MHGVDATHRCDVPKDNLAGADADDGAVDFKEVLNCLALLEPENMCGEPNIGDGGVPRAGDSAERRPEEIVYHTDGDVREGGRGGNEKKGRRKDRGEHIARSGCRGERRGWEARTEGDVYIVDAG